MLVQALVLVVEESSVFLESFAKENALADTSATKENVGLCAGEVEFVLIHSYVIMAKAWHHLVFV